MVQENFDILGTPDKFWVFYTCDAQNFEFFTMYAFK